MNLWRKFALWRFKAFEQKFKNGDRSSLEYLVKWGERSGIYSYVATAGGSFYDKIYLDTRNNEFWYVHIYHSHLWGCVVSNVTSLKSLSHTKLLIIQDLKTIHFPETDETIIHNLKKLASQLLKINTTR